MDAIVRFLESPNREGVRDAVKAAFDALMVSTAVYGWHEINLETEEWREFFVDVFGQRPIGPVQMEDGENNVGATGETRVTVRYFESRLHDRMATIANMPNYRQLNPIVHYMKQWEIFKRIANAAKSIFESLPAWSTIFGVFMKVWEDTMIALWARRLVGEVVAKNLERHDEQGYVDFTFATRIDESFFFVQETARTYGFTNIRPHEQYWSIPLIEHCQEFWRANPTDSEFDGNMEEWEMTVGVTLDDEDAWGSYFHQSLQVRIVRACAEALITKSDAEYLTWWYKEMLLHHDLGQAELAGWYLARYKDPRVEVPTPNNEPAMLELHGGEGKGMLLNSFTGDDGIATTTDERPSRNRLFFNEV